MEIARIEGVDNAIVFEMKKSLIYGVAMPKVTRSLNVVR